MAFGMGLRGCAHGCSKANARPAWQPDRLPIRLLYVLVVGRCPSDAGEELMYASDTDFASLLPDIKWPRSEDDDDSSSTEDNDEEDASSSSMSAAVNQLAEAVADVLTIAADGGGSEPAGICSSPAGAAPAPAVDHAELRSPEALPW